MPKKAEARRRSKREAPKPKPPQRRQRARAIARAMSQALPRLGAGGPPVGLVSGPNGRRQETHPFVGADTQAVHVAMMQALRGYPDRLMDLFDDMRDRDPRVDTVCRTRALAVQGRRWSVKPPEGLEANAAAQERARITGRIIRAIRSEDDLGWRTVVGKCIDGVLRGYAPFEIEWALSASRYHVPRRLHWRHPNRFRIDDAYQFRLWDGGSAKCSDEPILEAYPDKFLIYSPTAGRAAYPTRRGVMLGMVFPSLFKRGGWRWWVKASERWGMPLPYLELDPDGSGGEDTGSDEDFDEGLELINNLFADWGAVVGGGQKLNIVPGSGNVNPMTWTELVKAANIEIAVQGLGQNLTVEVEGGSFAAAKISNAVRLDILGADCGELDDWINAQLIPLITKYNWPGEPDSVYATEVERERPDLDDVREGVFTEDEYREAKGYTPKVAGGPYRKPSSATKPSTAPNPPTDPETPATEPEAENLNPRVSLNGAQVASLLSIIEGVRLGNFPKSTAVELMLASFPMERETADEILKDVPVPNSPSSSTPEAAPAPAPTAPPPT